MRRNFIWASLLALSVIMPSSVQADIVDFDFTNGSALDSSGPAGNMFTGAALGADSATLTVVDIVAPEYDGTPARTGTILSAAAGDTDSPVTSIDNPNGLGVNNQTINNGNFDDLGTTTNNGTEGNDLNPDEGIFFTFDQNVIIQFVEFEAATTGDSVILSVGGTDLVTLIEPEGEVTSLGALTGLEIAAGTEFGITAAGDDSTTSFRIESFQVDVVAAVPEPTSLALLGLASIGLIARRRR